MSRVRLILGAVAVVAIIAYADRHAHIAVFVMAVMFQVLLIAVRYKPRYDFDYYVEIYRESSSGNRLAELVREMGASDFVAGKRDSLVKQAGYQPFDFQE